MVPVISGLSNPDPLNAVVCKRFDGANSFVYISTNKANDWVKNNPVDFEPTVSPIGALAVVSAVPEANSSDFWSITANGRIAKFDGKSGTNSLSLTSDVSVSNNRMISSVDSSRAFYTDQFGSILQTGAGNSTVGWLPPGVVVLNDIYAIDEF